MNPEAKSAVVIIFNGVEELEAVAPIDLLRRAGIAVTVAVLGTVKRVLGRNGIVLEAETTLGVAAKRQYDAVVIAGGPGVKNLRAGPETAALVRTQADAGRIVAAICAAPTVLKDAGVLSCRRFTAHPSVAAELPELDATAPVVRDGNIITSRGAGTAILFGLEIIRALLDEAAAARVAESVCHQG
jgi:4-methyl-5(b-hydroxyethyl)-thiazole monophosphate biosynthesis